jgi:hypothetical protein
MSAITYEEEKKKGLRNNIIIIIITTTTALLVHTEARNAYIQKETPSYAF